MWGYPCTSSQQSQLHSSRGCICPARFPAPGSHMIGHKSTLRSGNQLPGRTNEESKFICMSSVLGGCIQLNVSPKGNWIRHKSRERGPTPTRAAGSLLSAPIFKESISSYFTTAIDHGILGATMRSSLRLALIFAVVGWLLNMDRLPESTGQVLSKVAFNLCIPAMLFTKVARVLTAQNDMMLLWIPVAAAIQIGVGLCIGLGAAWLLQQGAFFLPKDPKRNFIQPMRSSPAIATSTAIAIGNPMAASALVPKSSLPAKGLSRVVIVACMFGNSFTLPLVFMMSLLPSTLAEFAPAYVAMFLVGWSPLFWGLGNYIVRGKDDHDAVAPLRTTSAARALIPERSTVGPTGLYKSSSTDIQGAKGHECTTVLWPWIHSALSYVEVLWMRATNLWHDIASPPFLAILAGCVVGCTPLGKIIFSATIRDDFVLQTSTRFGEVVASFSAAIIKMVVAVLDLFGEATLSIATITLACSIFQKTDDPKSESENSSQPWWQMLFPADVFEQRALILVSIARFAIMPVVGIVSVMILSLLGALAWDPTCHLSVLLQSAMPPAQNLILMMHLSDETRPLVPQTARFLARMYVISMLPITFWTTVFAVFTGVELA